MPHDPPAVPLVFDDPQRFRVALAGREPAVFLDYDGTLTPIVARPKLAQLAPGVRRTLRRLAARYPVAVVSGREREEVQRLVDVDEIVYAGSHGFDIRGPAGLRLEHAAARQAIPALRAAATELARYLAPIDGALVEPKRFGVAAHYRRVAPERHADVVRQVEHALRRHPRLRRRDGKMVVELQPDIDWHKGHAVAWLIETLGLDQPGVVPIYLGDDATDEDAFGMLRERGVGIVVADQPRDTLARFRLRDPVEVHLLLDQLASGEITNPPTV